MKIAKEYEHKENEEIYKTIFENLPFVAFALDRKGRILEANKYTEQVFGLRIEDVSSKKFSEVGLLRKRDLLKAFIEFRKNLQGKVTKKTVYTIKLKNDREILLELVGIPLKEEGKVARVLIVGSDITDRKRKEEDLERKSEESEKFSKLSVGRELKMVELKKRIIELEKKVREKSK